MGKVNFRKEYQEVRLRRDRDAENCVVERLLDTFEALKIAMEAGRKIAIETEFQLSEARAQLDHTYCEFTGTMGSVLRLYVVCDDPEEWGDAPIYTSLRVASDEAHRLGLCVVELNYEYSESCIVEDNRPDEEDEE